jgi:hypothetical protein
LIERNGWHKLAAQKEADGLRVMDFCVWARL